jgi:hypothetical protein
MVDGAQSLAGDHLAGLAVTDEHHAADAREVTRLDDPVGRHDGGGGRDVEAGLHDAVVAQADADAGIGSEQAPFPDRDDVRPTARERAHDRRAAPDVAAVAHDDARRDAALDHRGAERAGVEVAEALVHHHGALREVGTQPDP